MERRNLLPLTALLSALAMPAAADWNLGAAYTNFSSDDATDISLNGVVLSVGYEFTQDNSNLSWVPNVRYGFGVGDDTVGSYYGDITLEVDSFAAVGVRGIYQVNPKFHLFFQPSYGNFELNAKTVGVSVSEDEWEFGYGAGFGFNATENTSLELLYERFDDVDVISAGLKYQF